MKSTLEESDHLIRAIHAAPLDETRWNGIVDSLRVDLRADSAMLFSVPVGRCPGFWNVLSQVDPDMPRDYALEFAPEDSWALSAKHLPGPMAGRIVTGDELIDRRKFRRSRYYNDFVARFNMSNFLCVLLRDPPFPGAPPGAAFSFYRGENSPAFDSRDREVLSRFAPHLVLGLSAFWRIRELSAQNGALSDGLDAVNAAMFIVDHEGRVIFENTAAQTSLRAGDCLRLVAGRLEPSEGVREQKLCRETLNTVLHGRAATVKLTLGSTDRTVILSTAPTTDSSASLTPWEGAAGLIWLVPTVTEAYGVDRVATLFALTPAEKRLLELLSAGDALASASGSLQISIHTARNQLKSIQRKTGWRTQNQLLRMVHQLGTLSLGCSAK
jgi:DNA-binding CsgD family transcriptional regulator